jgi:hypothetical protein
MQVTGVSRAHAETECNHEDAIRLVASAGVAFDQLFISDYHSP